jgi:integrase
MSGTTKAFRVGQVQVYQRGKVWYLCYHEEGQRRRPRVGPDRAIARQQAAEINSQLESGAPAALSFEPISLAELQARWLAHHEQVRRSSVQTIRRYRAATNHFISFSTGNKVPQIAARFRAAHAEEFVVYLRTIKVSPNGHENTRKRPLMDKGLKFILETCRAMFHFAQKRRHLPPYSENPFAALDLDRMPVETVRPIVVFDANQERSFLSACDDWQFPIFLTLILTGLRPGELAHLLLPDDVDLNKGSLRVRNKSQLGWQVKTRNEREIPLVEPLLDVLRLVIGTRKVGAVFLRRQIASGKESRLGGLGQSELERALELRIAERERSDACCLSRAQWLGVAGSIWREAGAIETDRIRLEFIRLNRELGQPHQTAPKVLRHLFATSLQDANVDPLIRNELMGHSPESSGNGFGLGMTTQYTHTRPETRRKQLELALMNSPSLELARKWIAKKSESK